jgi:hypothetical protein
MFFKLRVAVRLTNPNYSQAMQTYLLMVQTGDQEAEFDEL